jgi:hypothetical protein
MQHDEFLSLFEALLFPVAEFHHRDHVRLAWIYLDRYPPLEGLQRFTDSLKAFVAHHGATDKYHETLTWSFFLLIHERMRRPARAQTWEQFERTNPDLFDWERNVLLRYYREETLNSDLARSIFVLPDRVSAEPLSADA